MKWLASVLMKKLIFLRLFGFYYPGYHVLALSHAYPKFTLVIQEIKFEPNVMCEHIDKKVTFRASQVCIIT